MPYKKRYPMKRRNKKRFIKRRQYRPKKNNLIRSMRQQVYFFKRDIEATLLLSSSTPEGWLADGDSRIYNSLGWSLGSLGTTVLEFTNLFRQYRLSGARVKLFFSNTQSGEVGSNHANSQLIVRMAPNHRGSTDSLNQAYWQQVQAKKYRTAINGGKPLDVYMPLKQPTALFNSGGTLIPSLRKPLYINTSATDVVHYGLNLSIERADGQAWTSNFGNNQYCKMITTLYFQCKGVQ